MEVLRFHSEDRFDVYLQTTDIKSAWQRFKGRINNGDGGVLAETYAQYTSNEPCKLFLYNPETKESQEHNVSTKWEGLWPVVFETGKYQVNIKIAHIDKNTCPRVKHVSREVEDIFFADEDQGCDNYKLTGTIDFINEPGVFKLAFEYVFQGHIHNVILTFDVVSPKLDTKNDYLSIIRAVDDEYENVVFRYLSLTYQQFCEGHINNDVIWLNSFENLIDHYIHYVQSVVNRPHVRWNSYTNYAKADNVRKWTPAMEEKYKEAEAEQRLEDKYFGYEESVSNIDSLENRFVKYSVEYINNRLQGILHKILHEDKSKKRGDQLAESRKMALSQYSERLLKLKRHPFFRKIGRWQGMTGESLVLQSRQGYMQVYKDWIKLRKGIDLYNGAANIGTLQIWEIYELWCFIKMKHLIRKVMCLPDTMSPVYQRLVTEPKGSMLNPFTNSTMEHIVEFRYPSVEEALLDDVSDDMEDVIAHLKAHEGDVVSLHYQHTFNRTRLDDFNIHTATTEQRPDIVLNIRKGDTGEIVLTYLYDAKYRVYSDPKLDKDFEQTDIDEQKQLGTGHGHGADYPPSDAINQMHRYRDAIYYGTSEMKYRNKEVIGGYILFPGRGDDNSINNRYFSKSIDTVNIGAFPLTPNKDESKEGVQLTEHLKDILLFKDTSYKHLEQAIPQRGLTYAEEKVDSPMLLVGYVKEKNLEHVENNMFYYIRAMKDGGGIDVPIGFDKAEYVLVHTSGAVERRLYKIKGKPRFVTGKEIKEMQFETEAKDTDMYIGYSVYRSDIDDFDIYSVMIYKDKMGSIPVFMTLDELKKL